MSLMALALVAAVSLAVVAVLMTITALIGRSQGRVVVVDVAWGLGFVLVALTAAVVASVLDEGEPWRRWAVLACVAVWGLRLAWHTGSRLRGHRREDPRYAEMLDGAPFSTAVRRVFAIQGVSLWFVSLPVQVSAVSGPGWWPVAAVGFVIFTVGLAFEAIGDAQLEAYKKQPDRPPVMDRGLWGWTRHPNYFGDACVWWGMWVVAASAWPGVLTIAAPVAMTWFVYSVTGAKLLERTMMQRPGYREYAARVPMFFPRPPRT